MDKEAVNVGLESRSLPVRSPNEYRTPPNERPNTCVKIGSQLHQENQMADAKIQMCEHCRKKPAEFVDYRGPDVISKYKLCGECAALSDAEFFGIEEGSVKPER